MPAYIINYVPSIVPDITKMLQSPNIVGTGVGPFLHGLLEQRGKQRPGKKYSLKRFTPGQKSRITFKVIFVGQP